MNPTLALVWEMLARHRWMTAVAAVLLATAPWMPTVFAAYAVGMAAGLVMVIAGFGFEGALEARAGLFRRRPFVLPVSSLGLVLPPMLLTSGALLAAGGLMTLGGFPFWPLLLVAALAAWFQVVVWTPMPLPWVRLVLFAVLVPGGVAFGILASDRHWSGPLEPALLALTALAYPAAWAGVSLARRGVGVGEPAGVAAATREAAPFASPAAAQDWYEWRRLMVPALAGAWMTLLAVPVMILISMAARKSELLQLEPFASLVAAFGPGWLAAAPGLTLPAWIAVFGGMDLGRLREGEGRREVSAFQSGKPVDDGFFLAAKYRLVTRTALTTWAAAWLVVGVYSAAAGELPNMAERAGYWLGSPWAALAVLPAVAAGLFVLAWLWMARALWAGLWTSQAAAIGPLLCGFLLPTGLFSGYTWVAVAGLSIEALCMAFLARHSPHRGKVAAIVAVCLVAAVFKAWPVVLLAWPFAGLLLARTAIRRNRHR